MKLTTLYKSLIKEGQIEACVTKFGQDLFSPEFNIKNVETNLEDDYIELTHKFSGAKHDSRMDNNMFHMATNLKKCVSAYPDIIQPEGMIYRGIKVKISDLLNSFNHIKTDIQLGKPFEMVYDCKTAIQSWTNDEDIANDDFGKCGNILDKLLDKFDSARENDDVKNYIEHILAHQLETKVPIIIKYRTRQEDFIFKGKYFNHLSSKDEDELLRFDNRPLGVLAKIYPVDFSARLYDLLSTIDNMVLTN